MEEVLEYEQGLGSTQKLSGAHLSGSAGLFFIKSGEVERGPEPSFPCHSNGPHATGGDLPASELPYQPNLPPAQLGTIEFFFLLLEHNDHGHRDWEFRCEKGELELVSRPPLCSIPSVI